MFDFDINQCLSDLSFKVDHDRDFFESFLTVIIYQISREVESIEVLSN